MDWEDLAKYPSTSYDDFYQGMKKLVDEDGKIFWFDSNSVFGKLQTSTDNNNSVTNDYVHLNKKGQEIMAYEVLKFINTNLLSNE